jgi:hypothetical protein
MAKDWQKIWKENLRRQTRAGTASIPPVKMEDGLAFIRGKVMDAFRKIEQATKDNKAVRVNHHIKGEGDIAWLKVFEGHGDEEIISYQVSYDFAETFMATCHVHGIRVPAGEFLRDKSPSEITVDDICEDVAEALGRPAQR